MYSKNRLAKAYFLSVVPMPRVTLAPSVTSCGQTLRRGKKWRHGKGRTCQVQASTTAHQPCSVGHSERNDAGWVGLALMALPSISFRASCCRRAPLP